MAEPVVKVLDFEGPLDLLIHLIEKEKIHRNEFEALFGDNVVVNESEFAEE